jgi:hypothetical protein
MLLRAMRSVARPARMNSTQEARTAGSLDALTSNAFSQAGGTRVKRAAYCSEGSMSPTSILTPCEKISEISPSP